MAEVTVTFSIPKGTKTASVQKVIEQAVRKQYGKEVELRVARVPVAPTGRADRFAVAKEAASNAKDEADTLRGELQDWLDNMPENMQGGDKASQLEEAIGQLDEFVDALDNADSVEVEFPTMF